MDTVDLHLIGDLFRDDEISEIMVNGEDVYVEKNGRIHNLKNKTAGCDDAGNSDTGPLVSDILKLHGKRIPDDTLFLDTRLPDGSRVNCVFPPVSLCGAVITIRRFSKKAASPQDLVLSGTLDKNILEFLKICVEYRKNIVISGGTGSGKTTLLNVVSSFIPSGERIITIEDTAELQLAQGHVVRLEAGAGAVHNGRNVTIRQLVVNSLRMRPDRIIVGECRSAEALDMLQAMNTGHDGSLTTVHANSPRDALRRIEVMTMMSGIELPVRAIREQISSAIDVIVQVARFPDGSRKIVEVCSVAGMEGDVILMSPVFKFKQTNVLPDGRIGGRFIPTGNVPYFIESIRAGGINVAMDIFRSETAQVTAEYVLLVSVLSVLGFLALKLYVIFLTGHLSNITKFRTGEAAFFP
ncbi:MAG: CpaF family protein [Elusimicrobiota bacterium]